MLNEYEYVEFDDFRDANKCVEKVLKNILSFQDGDIKDSFFDAILNGLLFKLSEDHKALREKIRDVPVEEFPNKSMKENGSPQLADSLDSKF